MNNAHQIRVRNIFETKGDYSKVSVDTDTFNAVRGMSPVLPYTTGRSMSGKGTRVFEINGVQLMSQYDKETRKTSFVMKRADAVANLCSLEEQRSSEPCLPIEF